MALFDGLSKAERKARAAEYDKVADREAKGAREDAKKAKEYRDSLKAGSPDPAADRYLAEQHETNARIQAANAKDFRRYATDTRKRWF